MSDWQKRRDELAQHLQKTAGLHDTMGYTAEKAFRDGWDACRAEMLANIDFYRDLSATLAKAWDQLREENEALKAELNEVHRE